MLIPRVRYGCPCCDGRIDHDGKAWFCLDCEWRSDEDDE